MDRQYRHGMTNTGRDTPYHTCTHTYTDGIEYLSTHSEGTARGGRYLQWQGHREKWSRRWREVNKSDWMQ